MPASLSQGKPRAAMIFITMAGKMLAVQLKAPMPNCSPPRTCVLTAWPAGLKAKARTGAGWPSERAAARAAAEAGSGVMRLPCGARAGLRRRLLTAPPRALSHCW